ncbi:KxYKxGKxW signal peptide domain-containing protein, partial [Lactococcus lactis]
MYRSKHQKGYTTSHEVKTTRFRTWKSGKKWLYGATVLTLTASTLLPIGNLAFQPKTEKAQAASVSSGTLVPGNTSYDTGGHTYSGTEFANSSNYALYGKAVVASNWINLVSSTANSVGLGIFNGSVSAISATTGFTLKSTIKVDSGSSLTDFTKSGDAIGVILTGASKAQLAANAQSSQATNDGLGIRGLPNTVFLGRDLYSNLSNVSTGSLTGIDGSATVNGWTDGPGVVMAIRNTDSSGTLQAANYPSLGSAAPYSPVTNTQNGTAYTFATDTSYALGVASPITSSVQEPITVTWTPDATNTASTGYTSGTLTFNLIAQTTSNGALIGASAVNGGTGGYTLTTHTNLQNSLTVGFVGGTGGNYGNLSVSLNGATITG